MTGLTPGLWLYIIIVAIILLFSVVSNGLVIYCVLKFPRLRSVTHVLICNLALSDILLAGFVMPQRLHDLSHSEDFFEGEVLCKTVNFFPIFVITSSILTLVCVSFERRRAIIHSHLPKMTYQSLYKIVPILWIVSLLVSLPTLIEFSVNEITLETGDNSTRTLLSCGSQHMTQSYKLTNAIFVAITSYIVPTILMMKNYVEVATFLFRKVKEINKQNGLTNNADLTRMKSRVRVVKLLVVVAIIFALSWLPFFIMLLYAKITNNDASNDNTGFANLFLVALASFSTAYNVILYVIYNPSFSRAFKEILKCKRSAVGPAERIPWKANEMNSRTDANETLRNGTNSIERFSKTERIDKIACQNVTSIHIEPCND